jgi:hypothetical protein
MLTKENLQAANELIKTVSIKGKEYAQVPERVRAFRTICPGGQITTEIISLENGVVTMKATIIDESGRIISTGLAQEKETSSFINKTSFIENCETSAVGRALGFAGIGIDGSMASAEELVNAITNQGKNGYPSRNEMIKAILKKYPTGTEYYTRLCESFGVADLVKATDEQLQAAYNRASK